MSSKASVKQNESVTLLLEEVALDQLKPHPRNYRSHPEDEILHVMESIREHGIYRNIIIANEGTIIAGRCVSIAAGRLGLKSIPVHRKPYGPDDPRAIKLLIADNEISHLAENDDRLLTEMLRELNQDEIGLLGTGYDEMMLANLALVTRPASEIADLEAAAQWVGMPEYDIQGEERLQIIVNFATEEDRKEFCGILNLDISKIHTKGSDKSIWWPVRGDDDVKSIRFTDREREEAGT